MTHNCKRMLCSLACLVVFALFFIGSSDSNNNTYTPPTPRTSTAPYERRVDESQVKAAEEFLQRSRETGEYQRKQKEVDDYCNSHPGRCRD